MKILVVQDHLRSGGTERQSLLLSEDFAEAGHDTTLVCFRPGGALEPVDPSVFERIHLQPRDFGWDWFAPGLIRTARRIGPDIILCMGRMANCYAGWLQRALPSAVVISTLRTGKPLPWLFRRSLRRTRHTVANSAAAQARADTENWVPRDRISVIHNAVVFDDTSPKSSPPPDVLRAEHGAAPGTTVLLNVAMFRPGKNQRDLLDIVSGLPSDATSWQLWLAGDGPTLAACREHADTLRLGDRIRFLGWQADPRALYAAADIGVHASTSESLSNFLIEAQWHGLPVVANHALGVDETFLPGESGLLIPHGDHQTFRTALQQLLTQPQLRQSMAARGRRFARESFSRQTQLDAYLTLFTRLLTPTDPA